ncbi:ABC transporter permease [Pelotomaculum isophthalicicum JI]|uniref:Transport permease protein n=1 Tax=Pelotomaculum isophthalicicum JI TaxID=947010 RepID=A0A9X4H7S2_9FIRM|nr:ABC transporter permease [Pelotomaculum isophthalicicum]MDF9407909.1 ABC transporter permease [Pelotomaculum isophthalicicum JI]
MIKSKRSIYNNIIRSKDLLFALAMRDVKARYQLTILGLYWAIINPLVMALIMGFVFENVFRASGIEGIPYIVFLFTALTFWNLFSNSVGSASTSLTGQASLLSKQYFPRIIIPTATVLARLVDLCFSMVPVALLLYIYKVNININAWMLLLILIIHIIFTLGFSYLVSALNVLYRDVSQVTGLLLMLWMYLSPIFYSISQVPEEFRIYFKYNAIGQIVDMERNLLLTGQAPSGSDILSAMIISLGVFIFGYIVFKKIEPLIAEVL